VVHLTEAPKGGPWLHHPEWANQSDHHLNLDYSVIGWISSFLAGRTQKVVVDGYCSESSPVTSGVPQGTVVGPMLFLIYIDNITEGVTSSIRLFADDCLLYREIKNTDDAKALQQDLDRLHTWSKHWQMSFNIKKCNSMTVTNKRRTAVKYQYSMNNEPFQSVDTVEYLGVSISNKLSWAPHVNKTTCNARRTLGFLRRTLHHASQQVRLNTYRTLVRPKLEYASPIWDPHQTTLVNQVEKIQKTAARFILGKPAKKTTDQESVTAMVHSLNLPTLEQRRKEARCTLMFKMVHNLVAIPTTYHPQVPQHDQGTRRRSTHFQVHQPTVDSYKYAFVPRTIIDWNLIPARVTGLETLEAFKSALASRDFI
jgi:hypothetical protein